MSAPQINYFLFLPCLLFSLSFYFHYKLFYTFSCIFLSKLLFPYFWDLCFGFQFPVFSLFAYVINHLHSSPPKSSILSSTTSCKRHTFCKMDPNQFPFPVECVFFELCLLTHNLVVDNPVVIHSTLVLQCTSCL